jgi:3-phytase
MKSAFSSKGNDELAPFGQAGFTGDHEGISIVAIDDTRGYILVSDQQGDRFHVFERQGTASSPFAHRSLGVVYLSTRESDGSEATNLPLNNRFRKGLFVAMSDDSTFQYYPLDKVIQAIRKTPR